MVKHVQHQTMFLVASVNFIFVVGLNLLKHATTIVPMNLGKSHMFINLKYGYVFNWGRLPL